MKLCEWCEEKTVKIAKNKTCSRSCGSALRWDKLKKSGKLLDFSNRSAAARKTKMYKALAATIMKDCEEFGVTLTPSVRKLYIRARNQGHHNGYYAALRKIRNGTIQ